ncbi:uncharacterized protein RAG0_09829 [Rhynchosporium agropyri]|uniref:Uncharacterized protein n=1 Tax=Rhynchosporium agropyri TaxID=914238 RepID=A0A1E1KX73_9HELO|nr:uncharacterized protein RAG0_09829 [Rhynchosporium agropyri]
MANSGSGDDHPYPWGGSIPKGRPDSRHQGSSTSDVSSLGGYQPDHRDSVVSVPSPPLEHSRSYTRDEVDISRVQISSGEGYDITSPYERSRNHGKLSQKLPETLRFGTPSPTFKSGLKMFRSAQTSQSYEPISSPSVGPNTSMRSSRRYSSRRSGSSNSLLNMNHGTIHEGEGIDLSLLGSAMPMGMATHKTAYASGNEEDEHATIMSPMGFDVSSFLGPPQNEEQLRVVNRQEAAGILTGGLGAGWKPDATIRSADLYANSPISPNTPGGLTRGISFRKPSLHRAPALTRKQTVREMGQFEANKRGKIIEVIVEEPTFDMSSFTGDSSASINFDQISGQTGTRKSTIPVATSETFYPQDNWKPFSMRWPYITGLITISVILAAAQEYLFQKGALYTFASASKLSTWSYFTFKYLPTLVAVSFGVLWQVTDFEVKRLEAYYQLSRQGGALAAESINVDYITFFNFLRPIRALQYKHYAVAVSSIATLMAVSLVPTLQAASIELKKSKRSEEPGFEGEQEIIINAILSRVLSAILILIAGLGSLLVWQLGSRPSGLVADVKGIAGIAAMANRSHILMDFKNMDTATPELIHQTLKSHRYSLRNSSLAPEDKVPLTQEEKDKHDQRTRQDNPHPLMLRLIAGIPFIIGMILFMILVPIILFVDIANSLTTRAPWFLTALAVFIKLAWGTLETDVRMIEPFYILSKRHASPRVLTLDYTAMAFGWMPFRAFANGNVLVGLVGLGSVFAEILTVCSTSFANVDGTRYIHASSEPDDGEETPVTFWASFGLALFIILFLCLVAGLVYSRRRHPFLPRQPNTIASILAFIHQSKMLYDFVGTEKMNNDEMVRKLGSLGKTYGLGWFTGRDGEIHCGVDEEELISAYKHGDDARKASQPWRDFNEFY